MTGHGYLYGYLAAAWLLGCVGDGTDEVVKNSNRTEPDAGQQADDAGPQDEPLCSGCDGGDSHEADDSLHLHHVHLNVTDRERSMLFYETHFGAERVQLDGETEGVRAGAILVLFDEVAKAPQSALPTALQHVGFGSSDPVAWFDTAAENGVKPDTRGHTLFNTNETPTVAGPGSLLSASLGVPVPDCFPIADEIAYMYVLGPDEERIEVWSGRDGHINHVHLTTSDTAAAQAFYGELFGVDTSTGSFFVDDMLFFFEPDGQAADYGPTDDHVIGHFALSVSDLAHHRARAASLGIEVVSEPADVHGFGSFFIRGPDGVLIEFVEAAPAPGLCPNP